VLCDGHSGAQLAERAQAQLATERARHAFLGEPGTTVITDDADATRLWTFAGLRCNLALARALAQQGLKSQSTGDFSILLPAGCGQALKDNLPGLGGALPGTVASFVTELMEAEQLKVAEALPPLFRHEVALHRLIDLPAAEKACAAPLRRAAGRSGSER
jgi:hypothetical protein